MTKNLLILGIVLLCIGAIAIGMFLYPFNPDKPPSADDSAATAEGIKQVVAANNQFAFDIYPELGEGNVFYSPYSITAALAMTYEGAKGKTADEMKDVFHFPDALRQNFASIYNDINSGSNAYELRTGNALWVQQNFPLLEEYTSTVSRYYGGKAANLDFVGQPSESAQIINSFIEEQTNNKIKDLIPANFITPITRLILTNAIYFKGKWVWEFERSKTYEEDFKITPTNTVKAQMMFMDNDKAKFNYTDTGELQILELPYKGEKISMLILLPEENLDSLQLTAENLDKWKSQMQETKLDAIYLPKFEFDTKYLMKDTLMKMGMPTAFDQFNADFSGMTGKPELYIGFVIHQAYVKVDEEGTEAAAATAVGMLGEGINQRTVFKADHPFIFIIQDKETDNILFMGRVVDPTKKVA